MSRTPKDQEPDSAQDVACGATDAQLPLPGTFTIPPSQAVIECFVEPLGLDYPPHEHFNAENDFGLSASS